MTQKLSKIYEIFALIVLLTSFVDFPQRTQMRTDKFWWQMSFCSFMILTLKCNLSLTQEIVLTSFNVGKNKLSSERGYLFKKMSF